MDTPDRDASLPTIVLGGGGHAAVLIDALQCTGRVILGCVVRDGKAGRPGPLGIEILGDDSVLTHYQPGAVALVNGVGATDAANAPGGLVRSQLQRIWRQRGFGFATIVHPAATVAAACDIATGVQIMAGAVVQTGSRIGAGAIVNTGAHIDHDCMVGELVHIAPGATLCGGVRLGDGVFVGAGATIIPGVAVGASARIGAGMTILAEVPADARLAPTDAWRGDTPAPSAVGAATIP
jgi:sugar O-acyltransferase (sialic acid O-acetyltransferase NeuD family)